MKKYFLKVCYYCCAFIVEFGVKNNKAKKEKRKRKHRYIEKERKHNKKMHNYKEQSDLFFISLLNNKN